MTAALNYKTIDRETSSAFLGVERSARGLRWVERLDPAQGEDFGWERVKTRGTLQPLGDAEAGAAAAAHFVPAPDLARAAALKASRDHATLLDEGLVDKLWGFLTLWDGTVRLPADPSAEARFRLVIAEYEEYLVDDDAPILLPADEHATVIHTEETDR